jgi:hypothetical protein
MSYEQWKEEHRKHAEKVAERREEKQAKKNAPKMQKPTPKIKDVSEMTRSQLESTAYKIAVKLAPTQNISADEALRRAKLLMSAQSTPQLRKYINKHRKVL